MIAEWVDAIIGKAIWNPPESVSFQTGSDHWHIEIMSVIENKEFKGRYRYKLWHKALCPDFPGWERPWEASTGWCNEWEIRGMLTWILSGRGGEV